MKSILLEQFKTTHNDANHSIAQLVSHLIFWNQEQLERLQGKTPPAYSGKNDDTFNLNVDKGTWESMVKQLDAILTDWEKAIEGADEKTLAAWASTIAHIGTHNAYHTGQILYIRKQQGSWDPAKGVK